MGLLVGSERKAGSGSRGDQCKTVVIIVNVNCVQERDF